MLIYILALCLRMLRLLSRFCPSADCEATAKGRPKLREHLRSHTQEKVVACPGCGGMYANNTKLFDHIIRQNAMEGEKPCQNYVKAYKILTVLVTFFKFRLYHPVILALCECVL